MQEKYLHNGTQPIQAWVEPHVKEALKALAKEDRRSLKDFVAIQLETISKRYKKNVESIE